MTDKYIDVPSVSISQSDTAVKFASSSASTSNIYTGEMSMLNQKINREPLTSSPNKIT